ncbi:MAG TPA: ectoine/hydroxyectoine ABC transporter permease subunit EhuC [Actinomycetota bacterium]|nr:ectoine/hydroxyectoine ABC transporter permease subunit EhuC [Actinomycetota bacterium]
MPGSQVLGRLLEGAGITVQVTALAVLLGTVLALAGGLAGLSSRPWVRWVVRIYVELFRGVSAIILLFWVFFALPIMLNIFLSPLHAGVLALGTNMGAYGTELVRGGIQAVPRGQSEAATALNMTYWQRLRHVVFPQALVTMLPPYGSLVIEVLKASSLVSLIALNDLMRQAQTLRVNGTASSPEIFLGVFLLYGLLAGVITLAVRLAERRFGKGLDVGRLARVVK